MKTFTLRLTDEELEEVTTQALIQGISKNDYIRNVLKAERDDLTPVILEEVREIKQIVKRSSE